jgi:hypothetical protein
MPRHHNLDEYLIGYLDGDGLGEGPLFRTMGRGSGKLTRWVLKRTEELRGHSPVDIEGALSASAHSEVVAPRAGRGGTTSSNPLCSSSQSVSAVHLVAVSAKPRILAAVCRR